MIQPGRIHRFGSLLMVLGLCLIPATTAQANILFFTKVMQNLQHYRVSGDQIEFHLEGSGTGNLTFHLTLPSRRNNIEEVIVYGYLSAGYAIARTGLKVNTVYLTIVVPSAGNQVMVSKADAELLAQLISQEIDPHRFLGDIDWIERGGM